MFLGEQIPDETAQVSDAATRGAGARQGFTLVELLVVIVIIVMLASLVLTGLAAAQERTREEQTRSTISKLHGQVMLMWDEYRTRRVSLPATVEASLNPAGPNGRRNIALARLTMVRVYQRQEMPDTYADLLPMVPFPSLDPSFTVQSPLANFVQSAATAADQNESAECLFLAVTYGMNADEQVRFSGREVGDTDGDGNKEFLDGWGNPIAWLRWAPGFISETQHAPAADFHPDPFDPLGVDKSDTAPFRGFRLFPLIISAGPDGFYGIFPLDNVGGFGSSIDPYDPYSGTYRGEPFLAPTVLAEGGSPDDNIHSHAVGVK